MNERLYWVWLTVTMKFAAVSISRVLYKFTPREAYEADRDTLEAAGIDTRSVEKLSDKSLDRAKRIIEKCDKLDIKIITSDSRDYPRALDRLDDKPHVIYVRGDIGCIKGKKTACFIGTRNMTVRGEELAVEHARRLIDEGNVLISGIADGVDTVAARESIGRDAPTVAVLGVDIDKYYPQKNERLIDRVALSGAVISEYPPETGARFFPDRNRIIVGLSDTVNVIEAPIKSGSLIGARLALKKRIPTFACNGEGESFEGCRLLISDGAKPLSLDGKAPSQEVSKKSIPRAERHIPKAETLAATVDKPMPSIPVPESLRDLYGKIYERLRRGVCDENELHSLGYEVRYVSATLSMMEIHGVIETLPGRKFKLK